MKTIENIKEYDRPFLIKLLEDMLLIRRFEEKSAQMYGLQKIGGFCHLYIGQEAVAVGSIAALDLKKDYILTAYRDHGHALACGMKPNAAMAELYGKIDGCSRGKGGSMHLFDVANHMYGGNGIVGGHIPVATGVAFKIRYSEEDGVVLCYFGDGAIHQGAFHESLNLAKIWNLPIIYICENNQYGMGTDFRRVSSVHDLSSLGQSYGIDGRQVNGMDVLSVFDATTDVVHQAREKHQPTLLEIRTYRYKGHSMSDPGKYRTREELDEYRQQDPILVLKQAMRSADLLTDEDYDALDEKCRKAADEAADFAENSPEPALETLYEDILA
ncbi:MAG: pyruvate dehydrogenase (acetyl-transferring) E1 component subunit alpha [Ruminococcaceae bacterium]|jgi:pyruvate dehydrogenase E1 component alpha subunit|nr:pyruvate dehydrogenase (acetyl-transferring) E1 component subunit alpha [Oscillospiraceae bacterium]